MADYSEDLLYAWMQLGLAPGSGQEQIAAVLANARAARYAGKPRIAHMQRFAGFFTERSRFGAVTEPYEAIKKSYRKQAMASHPDNNPGDRQAEEQAKIINAGFDLVEKIHQEAKIFFRKDPAEREAIADDARQAALRESSARVRFDAASEQTGNRSAAHEAAAGQEKTRRTDPPQQPHPPEGVKFIAASVPRYIRNARLGYLRTDAVIGSRLVKHGKSEGLVYDIIMLPEQEFIRARLYLSMAASPSASVDLTMSKITPAYTPMDAKTITTPRDARNPQQWAREHFLKAFRLVGDGKQS